MYQHQSGMGYKGKILKFWDFSKPNGENLKKWVTFPVVARIPIFWASTTHPRGDIRTHVKMFREAITSSHGYITFNKWNDHLQLYFVFTHIVFVLYHNYLGDLKYLNVAN